MRTGMLHLLRGIAYGVALSLTVSCGAGLVGEGDGDSTQDTGTPPSSPTLRGPVQVRVLDGSERTETQYRLRRADGTRVELVFEADPRLRGGAEVELWGTWLDSDTLKVDAWQRAPFENKRLDAPIDRSNTHHRLAILAMQEASVDREAALRAANGGAGSFQHFMAETTGGIDTFSADVFRRYGIEYSNADCLYDNSDRIWDRMVDAFRADGFNPDDFDHIAVIVPRSCGSDWSGAWAMIGGIRNNGSLRFESASMYKDNAFDAWYLAHELGHNLGLNHSQGLDCGSRHYTPNAADCDVEEYGNHNDPMGWGEGVYWGTPHQRFMGWIDSAEVVTAGQSATFNLHPADEQSCGIRALRIPIPSEQGFYFYVEYRRARGDSRYAGTGRVGGNRDDAVLITRSRDGFNNQSFNQRIELGGSRYEGAREGQRYDLANGVSVTVTSMGGPVAVVDVQMSGDGTHRRDNGSAAATMPDGSIGLTACDGNPGGDECPSDPTKTAPGKCGCGVPEGSCGGEESGIQLDKTTFALGEPIVVRYENLPGGSLDWVGTFRAGTSNDQYLQYIYSQGRRSGTMAFDAVPAGDYEARLFFDDSYQLQARVAFTVVDEQVDECPNDPHKTEPGVCGCGTADTDRDGDGTLNCQEQCPDDAAKTTPGECGCGVPEGSCTEEEDEEPSLTVGQATFVAGEAIVVRYQNLPSGRLDWVGTFVAGTADQQYLQYFYTDGNDSGTMRFNPLPAGEYEARLFFNNSYRREASVAFTVAEAEVDDCPGDPHKTAPGVCGCGLPDVDADGDGAANCQDGCPIDSTKLEAGECGCGVPEGTCGGDVASIEAPDTFGASEAIVVEFSNLPGGAFDWVGIYRAGTPHTAYLQYAYSNGAQSGVMRFDARAPGNYEARLFFDDSYDLETSVSFSVIAQEVDDCPADPDKTMPGVCGCGTPDVDRDGDGAADCQDRCPDDANKLEPGECGCGVAEGNCDGNNDPAIRLSSATFEAGESIVVHFDNLPGGNLDWVGTYRAGTGNRAYLEYIYSNGADSGTMRFEGLEPGTYEARLFFDDSYRLEASVPFTVVAPP